MICTPSGHGHDEAKRAFDAMMGMTKIDIAVIKAARRG
jgi:predicted 3-demethylubiquinone-9 3-methyltransferase (glyoxalase superfamily)